jgi:dephospho-CoA kinase
MSLLLCFSGQIGSGKSSVTTAISAALGWRRAGFGDYLRSEIARLGGDPNDRKALQNLGQKLVEDDSAAFCSRCARFSRLSARRRLCNRRHSACRHI